MPPSALGRFLPLVASLLAAFPAAAESRDAPRVQAAQHYDQGVMHFERSEYAAAVESFLAADALVPSPDALKSAIAAARRMNDHLLVARVAEKALERENLPIELAAGAREALNQAARHLSRVEANCAPAPCELELDGKPIAPGKHWVLPGSHQIAAETSNGARAREQLTLLAGGSYQATVRPLSGNTTLQKSATEKHPAGAGPSKTGTNEPARDRANQRNEARPLSPAIFYVGVGTTLALGIAMTVSGIDTLSKRDDLPERPTEAQVDDVRGRVLRTDMLLGAATAYAGFVLVDWGGRSGLQARFSQHPGGAELTLRGRF